MIPFIDLAAQQERIRPQVDVAIAKVLEHGKYIMGPEVVELESALCDFVGSRHCISVSNGTDALIAAYMAWGIGPGDAIITTPFTFFATIEAILMVGATPVFADIDPVTFNICPNEIIKAIHKTRKENKLNLRGICAVDLFGLCADYTLINKIATDNGLFVLQDAAQAFGARRDGCSAPNHGLIGTTSFFPAKPLGCYGDGGAVFTDDDELASLIRSIRVHGKGTDKYDNVRIGQNCRLSTIQAAILLEKLKIYQSELDARQRVARQYNERIIALEQQFDQQLVIPQIPPNSISAWAQYTVRADDREKLIARLRTAGIPALVYYRTSSHLLGACSSLGYQLGDFPVSEAASKNVLSLPFHPYLTDEIIEQVVSRF